MFSYSFKEFSQFVLSQVQIRLGYIPVYKTVVTHTPNTSKLDKGKWSSWSEAWKEVYHIPVNPEDNICRCCCRKIKESSSNYFVVGHVTECETEQHYLHPVCNQCNTGMKKYKFIVDKKDLRKVITID